MGKITRRGSSAVAVAAAAALAFAPSALALEGGEIDIDGGTDGTQPDSTGPDLYRFAGQDRIATSIQAANRATHLWQGNTVIIANNQEYADALAAAPLADLRNAPVIVDNPGDAPSLQVQKFLEERASGIDNVVLVSGTGVFSASYADAAHALAGNANVDRYAGANRYETALELAEVAGNEMIASGDVSADEWQDINVFLADGQKFPDALAAGAAAANNQGVVLLTKGSSGVSSSTFDALTDNQQDMSLNNSVVAVGGPAERGAAAGYGSDPIEVDFDTVGANRYETAVMLAEDYFSEDAENFVLASGQNFPDAVVGGAFATNVDGPLLLTQETHLTATTGNFLEGTRHEWANGFTFGGLGSVSVNVTDMLAGLQWTY